MAGDDQELVEGSIRSLSAMAEISASASRLFAKGSLYGCCLIGLVLGIILILCSSNVQHPKS